MTAGRPLSEELPAAGNDRLKAGEALAAFFPDREVSRLEILGEGNINDTYLVNLGGEPAARFVLQRLNRSVFPRPELIIRNLRTMADHLDLKNDRSRRWEVLRPVRAFDGRDYFIDSGHDFWRVLNHVGRAVCHERLVTPGQGREAGRGLGFFHRLVSDMDPALLADTLPGFHCTPGYLAAFDRVLARPAAVLAGREEEYCLEVVEAHREMAAALEDGARTGILPVMVIHGDPKPANFMFDEVSGKAVCLIDLDTVKPGLRHYDIGDCLRSCCNRAGEDGESPEDARFDHELCRALLAGYLEEMAALMTAGDYEHIYPALRLMTFELGLRFLTDHLAGDSYFKVAYPGHNLQRALVQFALLEKVESSAGLITDIIRECCREDDRVS